MTPARVDSLVCVYCVAHGEGVPVLGRAPRGLPGGRRLRALPVARRLWAIVADVPVARFGEPGVADGLRDIDWVGECAAGHERVVEHVARTHTVVPAKLFTLFADEERALAHTRRMQRRLARIAERVRGCAEWGVRVHVDERAARSAARERASRASREPSGKNFLLAKKAEHASLGETLRLARREADRVFDALATAARDAVRRPAVTRELAARVLLDAVFLVPTAETRGFAAAVRRASTSLANSGCNIALTGPWPPYHFIAEPTSKPQ